MRRRQVERALSPAAATGLVGTRVGALKPSGDLRPGADGGTVFYDGDTPVVAYLPVSGTEQLRRVVQSIEYGSVNRTGGYANVSTTFGYQPRRPMYGREGCGVTALAGRHPEQQRVLDGWAKTMQETLEGFAPEMLADGASTMGQVNDNWKMGESSLWTSGVINKSSTLPYHRDAFNFPVWSAMPVLRRGMDGGHLHIPEYDLVLPCADRTAVFFPGYRLVHGVTPMAPRQADAYRYSVVFYALKGMKDCATYAQETALARERRTARERAAAERIKNGDRGIPGRV